ncbi:MAG: NAD(P)H-hydrate dehydratase [Gemmatimonadota bacterium]
MSYVPLRPFGRAVVPAPTGPQSAEFDRYAIEDVGVPQPVLMENAGRSAALLLHRLHPEGPVVGVVGAGNNGGDTLVLLRSLAAWGREVRAVLAADRPEEEGLLHAWALPTVRDTELDDTGWAAVLGRAAVVVDGILGTGVRGAPRKRQARAIVEVNRARRPVVAMDIPSGVDSETGAVPGEAVRADVTVAFGAPKLGSLLHPGRARVGRLLAVEIAFPPMEAAAASGMVITPAWAQARLPVRPPDTHKNAVGRVLIVAGREGMAGAGVMAARAAFRAGAGLVQICSSSSNREIFQAAVPEAIFIHADDDESLDAALQEAHAVAAGPGLGTDAQAAALLARVLEGPAVPTVLDADALNLVAAGSVPPLPEIAADRPLLVTPHPGEMARLTGKDPHDIRSARLHVVRDCAAEWGCSVLLKGAPSLVARPRDAVLVDGGGSSDLAVAGMGDVLTGVCGSLLAQQVPATVAGAVALYLSGRAAALADLGPGLTPGDVVEHLPPALEERGPGETELDFPFLLFDQDAAR